LAAAWATTDDADFTTARRLHAEYESNAVAADLRFNGRVFVVTGVVKGVGPVMSFEQPADLVPPGTMKVRLETGHIVEGVACFFGGAHRARVAALRAGQVVHVRGRCFGRPMRPGHVNFHGCEFYDGPPPAGGAR
jgi:hypothetical protein